MNSFMWGTCYLCSLFLGLFVWKSVSIRSKSVNIFKKKHTHNKLLSVNRKILLENTLVCHEINLKCHFFMSSIECMLSNKHNELQIALFEKAKQMKTELMCAAKNTEKIILKTKME